jgi:hypothetical protein
MAEAAEVLGTTKEAVRMRVRRGALESEKGADGRVYVWVVDDQVGDRAFDHPRAEAGAALVEELRDRVRYVERQLEAERQAHAEARRLLAAALERIPAIEAPTSEATKPREAPTEATEQPGRVEPQPAVGGAQEGSQRVPWWRRIFGG